MTRVMASKHQDIIHYIYLEFQMILGKEDYFFFISYSFDL